MLLRAADYSTSTWALQSINGSNKKKNSSKLRKAVLPLPKYLQFAINLNLCATYNKTNNEYNTCYIPHNQWNQILTCCFVKGNVATLTITVNKIIAKPYA